MPNPKFTFVDAPPQMKAMLNEHFPSDEGTASSNGPLSREDVDRLYRLEEAFRSGIMMPFAAQIAIFDRDGTLPMDTDIDIESVGHTSVIDYMREIVALRDRKLAYGVADQKLSQSEVDRLFQLNGAYRGGLDIPFEVQLRAYDEAGEAPYGVEVDLESLGGISLIDYLREVVELQNRKSTYGVAKGVNDPYGMILIKQRATIIYTRCALEQAESEVMEEPESRMVHFPMPDNAHVGKNGYFHLFPEYPNSPVAKFRGDGGMFEVMDCINFINNTFPEIVDEFLAALADA